MGRRCLGKIGRFLLSSPVSLLCANYRGMCELHRISFDVFVLRNEVGKRSKDDALWNENTSSWVRPDTDNRASSRCFLWASARWLIFRLRLDSTERWRSSSPHPGV